MHPLYCLLSISIFFWNSFNSHGAEKRFMNTDIFLICLKIDKKTPDLWPKKMQRMQIFHPKKYIGPPIMYTGSTPLGFLHKIGGFCFYSLQTGCSRKDWQELAKSEVAGGAQVFICSAEDALQAYMQWWWTCSEHALHAQCIICPNFR